MTTHLKNQISVLFAGWLLVLLLLLAITGVANNHQSSSVIHTPDQIACTSSQNNCGG